MIYRVNEIFTSIKGEGLWTGTPMHFIRLAGCNLKCDHCDTQFDSPVTEMEIPEIIGKIREGGFCKYVVITGGEPTLQELSPLVVALHDLGYKVHLESNGTRVFPVGIDWVCISPKWDGKVARSIIGEVNELKIPIRGSEDLKWAEELRKESMPYPVKAIWWLHPWHDLFNQVEHGKVNDIRSRDFSSMKSSVIDLCIEYAKQNPGWRVGMQLHKYWRIP